VALLLGVEPEERPKPKPRELDVTAARSPSEALVLLNALPIWDKRVRWAAFRRRGNTLIGVTEDGEAVHFEVNKLTRFAHAQAAILSALGVGIRAPRRGQIGASWLTAAELMIRAAGHDHVDAGRPEDDLRADIQRCFRLAGEPRIEDRAQLAAMVRDLLTWRRAPSAEMAPPAVFTFEERAWLCLPVLREWLSLPAGGHRFLTLPVLREHAGLLGFEPREVDLRDIVERARTTLWSGPLEVLDE